MKTFLKLAGDQRGASAIEYSLIAGLIAVAAIGAISALGGGNGGKWRGVSDKVEEATTPPA